MKRKLCFMAGWIGLAVLQAGAASITWDAPTYVSNDLDVVRSGGRFSAEMMQGGPTTVNHVSFRKRGGFTNIVYSSGSVWGGGIICPSNSVPAVSDEYRAMLQCVSWQPNGETYVIVISNLTVGTQYKVQIWGSNASAGGATVSWSDATNGGNSVTLEVNDGTDGRNLGQSVVGSFTADAATQAIYGSGSGGDAFLNAIQVRDLSLPDHTNDEDAPPPAPPPSGPADIAWDVPVQVSGDIDVATTGTLFAAENAGVSTPTANGVAFGLLASSGNVLYSADAYVYEGPYIPLPQLSGTASAGYSNLLHGVTWDNSDLYTITLTNLTVGKTYLVQLWTSNSGKPNTDTFSSGSNSVVLTTEQYVTGTFVAQAAYQTIQEITSDPANENPFFNAIQVRELTPPTTPFEDWMADYGVSDPAADDDGDGADNLYEYALDGDPTNAANAGIDPKLKEIGNAMCYIYRRRDPAASGLTYTVKIKNDLTALTWETNGYVTTEGPIDSIWTASTNSVPLAGNDETFYKLEIEQ